MRIALAQIDIVWENKKANLQVAENFIEKASKENVDLILFPEMSLTGFTMNIEDCSESTIHLIKALANKYSINIGIGYIEKTNQQEKGKNNYAIICPTGKVLSNYSKIHPFTFGTESKYYSGGDKIAYCTIKDFNISTFICYDLRFPEIFQIASKKSELITVAANWPKARINHWITLLKARAIENQCYIAGVNRVGTGDKLEYNGNSLIIDPLGNVIGSILEGMEGLIIAEIDINMVHSLRNSFPLKNDRREYLYRELNDKIIESIH